MLDFTKDKETKLYLKTLPEIIDLIRENEFYVYPIEEDLEFEQPYICWKNEEKVIVVVTGKWKNTFIFRKTMDKMINEFDMFSLTQLTAWLRWLGE